MSKDTDKNKQKQKVDRHILCVKCKIIDKQIHIFHQK